MCEYFSIFQLIKVIDFHQQNMQENTCGKSDI